MRSSAGWYKRIHRLVAISLLVLWAGSPAASAADVVCVGDCAGDSQVTVDDIIIAVNISLGSAPVTECEAADPTGSGTVTIDDIVRAVNNSLDGCPDVPPTPTPTVAPAGSGLTGAIESIAISLSGQIAVNFTVTDVAGSPLQPVQRAVLSPNEARVRFTIAHLEKVPIVGGVGGTSTRYANDINRLRPAYDVGGTIEVINPTVGAYRYLFSAQLPADFNPATTYSVGMQADRTVDGQEFGSDPVLDMVPSGGTPEVFAGSTTARCNTCHDPLIAHGNRREFRLCTLCHTAEAQDETGESVALRVMLHKLHAGKTLPSIVDGPPGAFYGVYSSFLRSEVIFAQKDVAGKITGVQFPRDLRECVVCHSGAPNSDGYKNSPSTPACTSCHDDVNPSLVTSPAGPPGTNHIDNRGFTEGNCPLCHVPEDGNEFDISVVGAHVVPERSRQLSGLNLNILGVATHAAGEIPTVSFTVTNNAGTPLRDLSQLERVAFAMSGPTTDYEAMIVSTAVGGGAAGVLVGPDANGVFQYTLATGIPVAAQGSWSIGAEATQTVDLPVQFISPKVAVEAAVNPVVTFAVDGSDPEMRRVVVDNANCAVCHGQFSKDSSIHGNLRNRIEYCVVCHNPNQNDAARRSLDPLAVAAGEPTASIDFKVVIHKIHTGDKLAQQPYIIYGFGPPPPAGTGYTKHDFGDVRFSGDRRNCVKCHVDSTYLLPPFPGSGLGTLVTHLNPANGEQVVDGRTPPITAVCTACHDTEPAIAHAETMTAPNGSEACAVCHDEGRSVAVSAAHAH